MMWPFNRTEEVRESSYSDAIISQLVASAGGGAGARPTATGALEASCSIVARCFAAAEVKGPDVFRRALGPDVLSMIGRALIRSGEICFAINTEGGRLSLLPCASWDVSGSAHPESWQYRLTINGPTHVLTMEHVPFASVVHIRLQSDPSAAHRGVAPLQSAYLAGKLSAETVSALADEIGGMPRGGLLPVPVEGDDPSLAELKIDLRTLGGSLATVESQGDWTADGSGGSRRPGRDWQTVRMGADPPDSLVKTADWAARQVFATCGIPIGLVSDSTSTGARESYRRLLHATIIPCSRLVEAELTAKFHTDIRLRFDSLFAGDIVGKARAFGTMTKAGMPPERAAALSGLLSEDD